jgi:tRNA(Ile)-lysidine synthase
LRNWLFNQGATGVDFSMVDKILALMERSRGTVYFELTSTQRIVIEYGTLRFENQPATPVKPQWTLHLKKGVGWKKDHGKGAGILPAEASFSAKMIGDSPVQVRGFEPGDRIKPMGMDGSRKLQDIFTDQKIPRAQRSTIPVVLCRDEIIWIPGYRTARGWHVKGESEKSIHICIEHNRTH